MRWLTPLEFFEQIENLAGLAYSSPGTGVVQWQLLLGLCYATGVHPRNPAEWERWVREKRDLSEVAQRLREPPFDDGRFRLFDPDRPPFGQNALLRRHMREHGYGTAQLVMERAADRAQLVDHVHLHDGEPLPLGAAVQAMLAQHHYGLGGRVRAKTDWLGKAFTYGAVGRLAGRVHTLALGKNCADTLRLNLHPTTRPGTFNYSWTDGRTRRSFSGKAADKAGRGVDGPADLCSVLGRSILLQPDVTERGDIVVTKVLMGAGELLRPLGQKYLQDVPLDGGRPLAPSPERALWRQSHALYAAALPNAKDSDLFSRLLALDEAVQLWTVGLLANKRSPLDWVSDTFPFHGAFHMPLLRASTDGAAWASAVDKAVQRAAATARDLVYPNARPEDWARLLRRFYPGGELWAQFEEPFHALLATIAEGTVPEPEARAAFAARLIGVARSALAHRLRTLPRTPAGRQARVLAADRLERQLSARSTPSELKEAAMASAPRPPAPSAPPSPQPTTVRTAPVGTRCSLTGSPAWSAARTRRCSGNCATVCATSKRATGPRISPPPARHAPPTNSPRTLRPLSPGPALARARPSVRERRRRQGSARPGKSGRPRAQGPGRQAPVRPGERFSRTARHRTAERHRPAPHRGPFPAQLVPAGPRPVRLGLPRGDHPGCLGGVLLHPELPHPSDSHRVKTPYSLLIGSCCPRRRHAVRNVPLCGLLTPRPGRPRSPPTPSARTPAWGTWSPPALPSGLGPAL